MLLLLFNNVWFIIFLIVNFCCFIMFDIFDLLYKNIVICVFILMYIGVFIVLVFEVVKVICMFNVSFLCVILIIIFLKIFWKGEFFIVLKLLIRIKICGIVLLVNFWYLEILVIWYWFKIFLWWLILLLNICIVLVILFFWFIVK